MFEVILFNGQYRKHLRYPSLKLARKAVLSYLPKQLFYPFAHVKGPSVDEFYGKSREHINGITELLRDPLASAVIK